MISMRDAKLYIGLQVVSSEGALGSKECELVLSWLCAAVLGR
jgi:hypothetical protein